MNVARDEARLALVLVVELMAAMGPDDEDEEPHAEPPTPSARPDAPMPELVPVVV